MPSAQIKRLMVTLTVSFAMLVGTFALDHGGIVDATPYNFIRCEDPPGTCDDQCDGDESTLCNRTAICCARQYFVNGQCQSNADTFVCFGSPSGGGGDCGETDTPDCTDPQ
jgi:hypothetical protein